MRAAQPEVSNKVVGRILPAPRANPSSRRVKAVLPLPTYVTLIQAGYVVTSRNEVYFYADEAALSVLVARLIDRGVAFADGPRGTPPAEIVRSLQERDLVSKDFDVMIWNPNGYFQTYTIAARGRRI